MPPPNGYIMARFCIINEHIRTNAIAAIRAVPFGYILSIAEPKRSVAQNAKLWAMLSDVSKSKPDGRQWVPETWKVAFMHSLGHQVLFCEGLDGSGPFPMGFKTSGLSVAQMADLITCVQEYGDRHGVEWKDSERGGWP